MAYRRKQERHLCFFVISPEVATWDGVIFTDSNATRTGHRRGEGLAGLRLINFETVKSPPRPWSPEWRTFVQAEVLVPDFIPLSLVIAVCFVSKASLTEGQRLWGADDHPPFKVDPRLFADIPPGTFNHPFLEDILLTDLPISPETVDRHYIHKGSFVSAHGGKITARARVRVLPGTRGKLVWLPIGLEQDHEFLRDGVWFHWRDVEINKLPQGPCAVEYFLNDIRWSRLEFECD
jgi:hypothetical protein